MFLVAVVLLAVPGAGALGNGVSAPMRPPPPPGTCQWCGHCCGAVPSVLPPWQKTYAMNESTVIMPCNATGLIDPFNPEANGFHRWAFASIDWSNGKDGPTGWSKGRPMDAEESLVHQAAVLTAANPKQKVGVYRNIVKASETFSNVRTRASALSKQTNKQIPSQLESITSAL